MLALSLAQLRTQAHRLIATALAIIIAVGFVVATLVLNSTFRNTVFGALTSQYRTTDGVVAFDWNTGGELPTEQQWTKFGEQISQLPEVAAVAVDHTAYVNTREVGADGYRYAQVQSLAEGELRWQKLESGTWPQGPGQVVAAPSGDLEVGTRIEMQIQAAFDNEGNETAPARSVEATVSA